MKLIKPTIDNPDIDVINGLWDVISEIVEDEVKITEEMIYNNFARLPNEVIGTGLSWGWNDTVFRDDAYVWFKDHGVI